MHMLNLFRQIIMIYFTPTNKNMKIKVSNNNRSIKIVIINNYIKVDFNSISLVVSSSRKEEKMCKHNWYQNPKTYYVVFKNPINPANFGN